MDAAGSREPWRHRFRHPIQGWLQRRLERRLREEWEQWRASGTVKRRWFARQSTPSGSQNFRSLLQVNFYRMPPR